MPRGRPSRAAIHARLEEQVAALRARYGGLPSPEEAEGIWTDIWYQEAHHSTAIEGNTLVRPPGRGAAVPHSAVVARQQSAIGPGYVIVLAPGSAVALERCNAASRALGAARVGAPVRRRASIVTFLRQTLGT